MNALGDAKVVEYLNENFVCTYLKVGTFQIINGQKVGGNVASYFCLGTGEVIHAIPGKVDANQMISEARFAHETRKSALTFASSLTTGNVDLRRYSDHVKRAHTERFHQESRGMWHAVNVNNPNVKTPPLPATMPLGVSQQAQAHWLLASRPLVKIDDVYRTVWTQILGERISTLPVVQR